MKNVWMSLLLTITFFFLLPGEIMAETTWQITWDENSASIVETVITDNQELAGILSSNDFKEQDKGHFGRQVKDWATFNDLEKKFPIKGVSKNFIIFTLTTIYIDDNPDTNILRDINEPINFQYTSLGLHFKNTGQKISESTSKWNLTPGFTDSLARPYLTKCIFFNGFALGVFILSVGLIFIAIFFVKTVKRVNTLIEEEYSIENYMAKQEKQNQDEK